MTSYPPNGNVAIATLQGLLSVQHFRLCVWTVDGQETIREDKNILILRLI
ncbi:Hypothetical protein FKW44_006627 [Caligus rogercresseyi]|uniref:Uncharacterized protein n=1 Tax=Caligus rogercresseyi TaxID=217165 RepID=A0A7T8KDL0_CALRO|nr:Hypothetical protein FKW44_006627 [Caligus rogercresseyi]